MSPASRRSAWNKRRRLGLADVGQVEDELPPRSHTSSSRGAAEIAREGAGAGPGEV